VAAEALGRMGDARAIPGLLEAFMLPADPVLDHALTFALMEIGDAGALKPGLQHADDRVRRSVLTALDQMDPPALEPQFAISALNAPHDALRETAAWIASRHPEWGEALAGAFRERLASPDSGDRGAALLQQQLALLCKAPEIRDMLAAAAQSLPDLGILSAPFHKPL